MKIRLAFFVSLFSFIICGCNEQNNVVSSSSHSHNSSNSTSLNTSSSSYFSNSSKTSSGSTSSSSNTHSSSLSSSSYDEAQHYTLHIKGKSFTFNDVSEQKGSESWISQYKVSSLNVLVGDELRIKKDDKTIYSKVSEGGNNLVLKSDGALEVKCTTTGADFYLKVFEDGYESWLSGYSSHEHSFEVSYDWSDDYSICTGNAFCKEDNYTISEKCYSSHKIIKEPTCEGSGQIMYEAAFNNEVFSLQTIKKSIGPLGHTISIIEKNKVEPTCEKQGSVDLIEYCSVCKKEIKTEHKILDALGHDFKLMGCDDVYHHFECTRCGRVDFHAHSYVMTNDGWYTNIFECSECSHSFEQSSRLFTVNYNDGKATISDIVAIAGKTIVIPAYINSFPVYSITDYAFSKNRHIKQIYLCSDSLLSLSFAESLQLETINIPHVLQTPTNEYNDTFKLKCFCWKKEQQKPTISIYTPGMETVVLDENEKTIKCENHKSIKHIYKNGDQNITNCYLNNLPELLDIRVSKTTTSLNIKNCPKLIVLNDGSTICDDCICYAAIINNAPYCFETKKYGIYDYYLHDEMAYITNINSNATEVSLSFRKINGVEVAYTSRALATLDSFVNRTIESFIIEENVTTFGFENIGSWLNVSSLKTFIDRSNSVLKIDDSAFENHFYFETIELSDGLISIGNYSFRYCDNLKTVVLPRTMTKIGREAFFCCHSLESITYCGTKAEWDAIEKGSHWHWTINMNHDVPKNIIIHCTDGDINTY